MTEIEKQYLSLGLYKELYYSHKKKEVLNYIKNNPTQMIEIFEYLNPSLRNQFIKIHKDLIIKGIRKVVNED